MRWQLRETPASLEPRRQWLRLCILIAYLDQMCIRDSDGAMDSRVTPACAHLSPAGHIYTSGDMLRITALGNWAVEHKGIAVAGQNAGSPPVDTKGFSRAV